jgi:hypothetical protein
LRKELGGFSQRELLERGGRRDVLHSSAATGPVAVVEVDALALQDEGADAVLERLSA